MHANNFVPQRSRIKMTQVNKTDVNIYDNFNKYFEAENVKQMYYVIY